MTLLFRVVHPIGQVQAKLVIETICLAHWVVHPNEEVHRSPFFTWIIIYEGPGFLHSVLGSFCNPILYINIQTLFSMRIVGVSLFRKWSSWPAHFRRFYQFIIYVRHHCTCRAL